MKIEKSREGGVWWRTRDTRATCQNRGLLLKWSVFSNLPDFLDLNGIRTEKLVPVLQFMGMTNPFSM